MSMLGPCGTCWHWKETGEVVPASLEDYVAAQNADRKEKGRPPLSKYEEDALRLRHVVGRLGRCERRLHSKGLKRQQPLTIEHGQCGEWTPLDTVKRFPANCIECRFFIGLERQIGSNLPAGAGICGRFAPLRDWDPWHSHPAGTAFEFPYTEREWKCGDGISREYEEDIL